MAPAARIGVVLLIATLLAGSAVAQQCSGCGCKGGPGYRKPDGRCASWAELNRVCGTPPTLRCKPELVNTPPLSKPTPKPTPKPKSKPRT